MLHRLLELNGSPQRPGTVVYWMSRDQRADDNWALLYARSEAVKMNQGLAVVFCKSGRYLGSTPKTDGFMTEGLRGVYLKLKKFDIPFIMLEGDPAENIAGFCGRIKAGLLVADFNPLGISAEWKLRAARKLNIRFAAVDAHNVVPCFAASDRQEYAAHTFRPKVLKKLNEYLTDFPELEKHPFAPAYLPPDWPAFDIQTQKILENGRNGYPIKSGEDAAKEQLRDFIARGLKNYGSRNDPNGEACSGLSPYLHFGQISAQRAALEIMKATEDASDFLEELIVRRELADNFCCYNRNYDNPGGFPDWAKKTHDEHRLDRREYLYGLDRLENAETHDRLWNAAQTEMVKTGRMHGYLRMYWAKMILGWSETAEEAMRNAVYLNDKYQLDGRDPNGYTGIAWSVGGVHDRAWGERDVFGKIRYMSYSGCRRKFDVEKYIRRMAAL